MTAVQFKDARLNGAASRFFQPGDVVIIVAYAMIQKGESETFTPRVAIMDETNQITQIVDQEAPLTKIKR